jgi:integrase
VAAPDLDRTAALAHRLQPRAREGLRGHRIPKVSPHGLRHTYVSWMIDEGHSADKIAFWIGDTPQTVRLVYAHMLEASSAPAAAAMDAALDGFDRET